MLEREGGGGEKSVTFFKIIFFR